MDAEEHARRVRQLVHEFNNQLFVIGGHCELLSMQLEPGSRAHADLAAILEATDKASDLAVRMRELAVAFVNAVHAVTPRAGSPADVDAH